MVMMLMIMMIVVMMSMMIIVDDVDGDNEGKDVFFLNRFFSKKLSSICKLHIKLNFQEFEEHLKSGFRA